MLDLSRQRALVYCAQSQEAVVSKGQFVLKKKKSFQVPGVFPAFPPADTQTIKFSISVFLPEHPPLVETYSRLGL